MYKYKSLQKAQLPWEHFLFLKKFIITKYLKQEVDDHLSTCMDERSPCGLSITRDININVTWSKGNDVTTPNREVLCHLISWSCFYCLKLVSAIFIKCLFFHQMIALQQLWKMLFISSEKLYLLSRYSNFCIYVLPSFSAYRPLL